MLLLREGAICNKYICFSPHVLPPSRFLSFLSEYKLIQMLPLPLTEHSNLIDYVLSQGLGATFQPGLMLRLIYSCSPTVL